MATKNNKRPPSRKFVSLCDPALIRVVLIEWEDAAHTPYWQSGNDVDMLPINCVTVGVVMADSRQRITVAQTVSSDNHAHRIQIPHSCIAKIEILAERPALDDEPEGDPA